MKNKPEIRDRHWLVWSSLYAAAILALAGYLNYTEPYSSDLVTRPILWQLILWGSLYLPVVIIPIVASPKVIDFGFTLNLFLALAVTLVVALCAYSQRTAMVSWSSALVEAFARTGEEVFFRGFLFVLFNRLFEDKRRPWLWAAIASSILFALIHTQTFQPAFLAQYGSSSMPVGYQIVERMLNVFGLAFAFALLRVWTHSILPGAIAHSLLNSSIAALPFVLFIYGVTTFWAYVRGEPVIIRVNGSSWLD